MLTGTTVPRTTSTTTYSTSTTSATYSQLLTAYMPLSVLGTGRIGLCVYGMEYTILGYGVIGQTYIG